MYNAVKSAETSVTVWGITIHQDDRLRSGHKAHYPAYSSSIAGHLADKVEVYREVADAFQDK
jgi:hypothetical protein